MKKLKVILYRVILLITTSCLASCEKYLSIEEPNDKLSTSSVFADSASASSAITGIYSDMMVGNLGFVASQMRWGGLSSDELSYSGSQDIVLQFLNNNLIVDNTNLNSLWVNYYKHIYQANSIVAGVSESNSIAESAKKTLTGEAEFIRAFLFFYLVNNWGDVPLTLTTDYHTNESMPRTAITEIYTQIVTDLEEALEMLPIDYPTAERVRPNKSVARALLARVLLYRQSWQEAETMATYVIESGEYLPLAVLDNVFLKDSRETIWQFSAINPSYNTYDGSYFVPGILTGPTVPTYIIPTELYDSFELADQRKDVWIGEKTTGPYFFPYKYKLRSGSAPTAPTEYTIVFRLAEQYLIRAEARAHQNDLSGAIEDLDIIRNRAGLEDLPGTLTQTEVLQALENERRHELFCEWGHRWFDLKRTGRANEVLSTSKGNNWQSTDALWPIPLNQILTNPFLNQNEGY